jgi:hypothetical protein
VQVGEITHTLRAGQKALASIKALRRFHNATDEPVTFLVELRPGHAGFEKALKVGYGLARDGRTFTDGTPKNLYYLALLLVWSEVRLPGIFTIAEPLFRLLAKRAWLKGVDRELEARYCR